jgi:hypothetical protein
VGESFTAKQARRKRQKDAVSRAASLVLGKIGPLMDEGSFKLADMYDAQMAEKDTEITEAKQALTDFETQRHKIRQETFIFMAKAEDASRIPALRQEYETSVAEIESLLEQKEHRAIQTEVFEQDQLANPQAFRFSNPHPLTADEIRAALPWAGELNQQQGMRKYWVQEIARLMAEAGTSEKVGKHRKLVAIATGLKEEELDDMSAELLGSLQDSAGVPHTPPHKTSGTLV